MFSNIKLSLSKLNPLAILALLRIVVIKMTGNAFFPDPAVALSEMTTAGDELETAISEAKYGGRESKIKRDGALEVVKELLRKQAAYVRSICFGDRAMLASSGYALVKDREPVEELDRPKGEVATGTKSSGEIEVRVNRVHGAHFYKVFHSAIDPTNNEVVWTLLATTTRVRNVFKGFEPFQPQWFRVTAVGVSTESLPSDVAMGRAA